jgi:hypothetical protein
MSYTDAKVRKKTVKQKRTTGVGEGPVRTMGDGSCVVVAGSKNVEMNAATAFVANGNAG